jgi:hypothetical protein
MKKAVDLSSILAKRLPVPTKHGASHEWQDRAVRVAEQLGLDTKKLPKTWFKAFKTSEAGTLERAYRYVSDYPNAKNKLGLFFWALGKFKKEGCIPSTFTS